MDITVNEMIVFVLYAIYIILQIVVGFFLLYKIYKTRIYNLLALVSYFFINSIKFYLLIIDAPFLAFQLTTFLPDLCLILFTKYTFHRWEKSPFKIILGVFLVVKIIDFILNCFIPFTIPMKVELNSSQIPIYYGFLAYTCTMLLISNLWLAFSSLNYYKKIKTQSIAPWIQKRYQIIGLSSISLSATGILILFVPWTTEGFENPFGLFIGILILLATIIFSIGNVIGWMMPKKLKNYFNGDYDMAKDKALTEGELMDLLKDELTK